jgi:hypothetical protein
VEIELNKVYFEKEKSRFAEHVAEGDIFSPIDVVEPEEGLF